MIEEHTLALGGVLLAGLAVAVFIARRKGPPDEFEIWWNDDFTPETREDLRRRMEGEEE